MTDMDDKPIEQGEGGCVAPRWCGGPPKYLFHQYNPATFLNTSLDASVFEVPAVCKSSSVQNCLVQPTNFCSGGPDLAAGSRSR